MNMLRKTYGGMAQLGARLNGIQEAAGSNPAISTLEKREMLCVGVFPLFSLISILRN